MRRRGAAVAEASVVSEEEELVFERTDRNEWTAEVDAVFVALLNRLYRQASDSVRRLAPEAPCVERGIAEELIKRAMQVRGSLLDGVAALEIPAHRRRKMAHLV